MTYATTKELPSSIKSVLKTLNYGRTNIEIAASEFVTVGQGGGAGHRAFYAIVALDGSCEPKIETGSWGGSNPFENRRVDNDNTRHPIVPGFAVIVGSAGSSVFARIYVHPSNMAPLLPIKSDVTERQGKILYTFKALTSAGRKNEWERWGSAPTTEEIDQLVSMGLLKKNAKGAVQITTEGKNSVLREV